MEGYTIREVNSEILVFLGKNYPTKLSALQAGARVLATEVLREKMRIDRDNYREQHNDGFERPTD